MDVNVELIQSAVPLLLSGAAITIEITALSVFFGMLIVCFFSFQYFSGTNTPDFIRNRDFLPLRTKNNTCVYPFASVFVDKDLLIVLISFLSVLLNIFAFGCKCSTKI